MLQFVRAKTCYWNNSLDPIHNSRFLFSKNTHVCPQIRSQLKTQQGKYTETNIYFETCNSISRKLFFKKIKNSDSYGKKHNLC